MAKKRRFTYVPDNTRVSSDEPSNGHRVSTRRFQSPKGENKGWMRARVQQSNLNLTVPSGKAYKRPKAGSKGRDW